MSLQGSLETFALPDVLVLLSSTKKDGELRVAGGRVDGRIWLEKGQLVHSTVGGREAEFVDALFELLRLATGTFNFDADSKPTARSEPQGIDLVLADAQVRLGEWNDIARVVPHLDAVVDMADEAPDDEVIVTSEHWRLLRSVAGGRSVHDLMEALGTSEFDTCKQVKTLVDARLASIDVDARPTEASKPATEPSIEALEPEPAIESARGRIEAKASDSNDSDSNDSDVEPAPSARLDPGERPDRAEASPARPVRATTASAPARRPADDDELDALAALASQPRKVRATTNSDDDREPAATRPAATKSDDAADATQGAKALVAQLAALSGDDEDAVAAKVTEHLASGGELPDVVDGDEPINRGLLLKFLSSVRN